MRDLTPETARINGLSLSYLSLGEGPLVLLQHGFPDTPYTWDAVAPRLAAAGFRVVCPFGRGIFPSARPDTDAYTAQDIASDLVGFIGALGEEQAIVVGHDWGALAAWGAAHLAPARVRKLVCVAIPHPATLRPSLGGVWKARHFVSLRLPGAAARFRRDDFAAVRTLYERWSPGHDWPEDEFEAAKQAYREPGCLEAALGYYRCLGPWPWSGSVEVETLVIGGETDGVARPVDFERSRERAPGCRVALLPGGHFLHREHPEAFIEALLSFVRG